jgi:RNA-directed DNA polymerase
MSNRVENAILQRLHLDFSTLRSLIKSCPYRYRNFPIVKKDGSERIISQPAIEVKILQNAVIDSFFPDTYVHPSSTAYGKGCSIKKNAIAHANSRFILKMDFKNFFHSFKENDVVNFLRNWRYPVFSDIEIEQISRILLCARLTSDGLCLSIGAPSSPRITNLAMHEIDESFSLLARVNNCIYTRYADDITFSTKLPNVLANVESDAYQICESIQSPLLRFNHAKTMHLSRKARRRVTGVVITNDGRASIGRENKRVLRAMIHKCISGEVDQAYTEKTAGFIAYCRQIDENYYNCLVKYYGESEIRQITRTTSRKKESSISPEQEPN